MKRTLAALLVAGMLLLAMAGSALAAGKMGGAAGGFDPVVIGEEIPTLAGSKLGVGSDGIALQFAGRKLGATMDEAAA
jgi:hypothetical protein